MRSIKTLAALVAIALCVAGVAAQGQDIPSTFFGMGVSQSSDLPKVVYGTLSHPPLAWTAIETSRGVYDFSSIDKVVAAAPRFGTYPKPAARVYAPRHLILRPKDMKPIPN
jgi:hypothetical protein